MPSVKASSVHNRILPHIRRSFAYTLPLLAVAFLTACGGRTSSPAETASSPQSEPEPTVTATPAPVPVAAFTPVPEPAKVAKNGQDLIAHGQFLLTVNKRSEAIAAFTEAIRLEPENPAFYIDRAQAYVAGGEHELAVQDFDKAIRLDPNDPQSRVSRSEMYVSIKEYEKALEDLNEAIRIDPESLQLYHERASLNVIMGRREEAINDIDEVIRRSPPGVEDEQLARAREILVTGVVPTPEVPPEVMEAPSSEETTSDEGPAPVQASAAAMSAEAQSLFGTNLIANGDAEAGPGSAEGPPAGGMPGWTTQGNVAVVQYGSEGGFPGSSSPGPDDRGVNFFAGGPGASGSSISQIIDVSAASAIIDAGGVTFDLEGYLGGSGPETHLVVLTARTQNEDNFTFSAHSIGPVNAADRAGGKALLLRTNSGKVAPGTRTIAVGLTAARSTGSYSHAYADNLSLVLKEPPPVSSTPEPTPTPRPPVIAQDHYQEGERHRVAERYEQAITSYTEAIRLDPDQEGYYNTRGHTYAAIEEFELAVQDFTEAIRLGPDRPLPWVFRAEVYSALNEFEKAVGDLNEAIRLDPSPAKFYEDRGLAYVGLGAAEDAIRDINEAFRRDPSYPGNSDLIKIRNELEKGLEGASPTQP